MEAKSKTFPKGRILGVEFKTLKVIPDQRGRLMEILRCDDPLFEKFGQVYMTTGYPGVVKAWHFHKQQTDFWAVIHGMALVALYDQREDSPTRGHVNEFFMGIHNPGLLKIPPGVLHGFKCISEEDAIIVNTPTYPYCYSEPDEFRVPAHDPAIGYNWAREDG